MSKFIEQHKKSISNSIVAFSLFGLASLTSGCGTVAEGERDGVMVRVTQKGYFTKSWEAEMAMANFKGGGGTSNTFDFTIEDPAVLKQLQTALDKQQVIKIAYREQFCRDFLTQGTSNLVKSITVLENVQEAEQPTVTVDGKTALNQQVKKELTGNSAESPSVPLSKDQKRQLAHQLASQLVDVLTND